MRRLSLDHLTVTDATPALLAETAAATGCAGICLFLHAMPVLPAMPDYDLVGDPVVMRTTRAALRASGVAVDLVYPFTLTGRTVVADFKPALAAAAELGAPLANVLCYDRDAGRRLERVAELAELAAAYGIALAIEFYSPSQVGSFAAARALVEILALANVGVTLDLLHLTRAGEWPDVESCLREPCIRIAQLSDGPAVMPSDWVEWEAGVQRLLPGEGEFDIAGFVGTLDPSVILSVEVPQQAALAAGVSIMERARGAVDATRKIMKDIS